MPQLSQKQKALIAVTILGVAIAAILFWAIPLSTDSVREKPTDTFVPHRVDDANRVPFDGENNKQANKLKPNSTSDITKTETKPDQETRRINEPNPQEDTLNRAGPTNADTNDERSNPKSNQQPNSNTITRDEILEVVQEMKPGVKKCYTALLKTFPKASGKVAVKFEIVVPEDSDEGRVELAELGDGATLFDDELHDCLLEKFADLRFEAEDGPASLTVTYPFNFATEDPTDDD